MVDNEPSYWDTNNPHVGLTTGCTRGLLVIWKVDLKFKLMCYTEWTPPDEVLVLKNNIQIRLCTFVNVMVLELLCYTEWTPPNEVLVLKNNIQIRLCTFVNVMVLELLKEKCSNWYL